MNNMADTNVVTEISVKVPITKQRISDLLCSAFGGGSNYWYMIDEFIKPPKLEWQADPERVYWHLDYPLNEGGALVISDKEDDEPVKGKKTYHLDLKSITKGVQTFTDKYPYQFSGFLADNDDAITGDCFLQCCLFGEVIYG
jgi:hypothetical protein